MNKISKRSLHIALSLVMLSIAGLVLYKPGLVSAQAKVQCGSIVQGEFTGSLKQTYLISIAPGDGLDLSTQGVGNNLALAIWIYSPSGEELLGMDLWANVSK